MAVKTLSAVVLKTVLVGNKLPTPADRIGSGFVADIGHYPTTFLSLGQFPLSRLPEPLPRSRREVVDAMSMPPAREPAGPAGSVSGVSACRGPLAAVWRANEANPRARATTAWSWPGSASRASRPWSLDRSSRVGCDCQSPDRHDGHRTHDAKPTAVRQRTATRTTAAGK